MGKKVEISESKIKFIISCIYSISDSNIESYYSIDDKSRGTTCAGDSGSPLFVYKDGEWQVVGDLSTGGPAACLVNEPQYSEDYSQWTNLTQGNHLDFIFSHLT